MRRGGQPRCSRSLPKALPGQNLNGSIQARLSIPSAGIDNLSVGSVSLAGLTRGAFTTAASPALPASAVDALNAAPSDVQLQFAFDMTIGSRPYYLDNVRFED
ncbi:hypothetical protein WMF01_48745 [Sorangium sp. So ce1667]